MPLTCVECVTGVHDLYYVGDDHGGALTASGSGTGNDFGASLDL